VRILEKSLERIYNGDFIERIAKLEVYSRKMAKKIGHFNVVIEPLSKARLHSMQIWIS
jgi:putative ABC transport system permease protein